MKGSERDAMFRKVQDALESLSEVFVPEYRMTFIGRLPGDTEADVLVTSELDLDELKHVVDRTKVREKAK